MHALLLLALAFAPSPDAGAPPDPLAAPRALFAHRLDRASLDAAIAELKAMHWHEALLLNARAHRFRAEAFELRRRPLDEVAGLADLEAARALGLQAWQLCAPGAPRQVQDQKLASALAQTGADCVPALIELAEDDLAISAWRRPIDAVPLLREALALAGKAEQFDPAFAAGAPRRIRAEALAILPPTAGGSLRAARFEFERAIAAAPEWVANRVQMAARYAVEAQDRALFHALLQSALAINVRAIPDRMPEQLLARTRALALLHRERELFRG